MNIDLKTEVKGHYHSIMDRFDLELFEALKPPGVKMKVRKFTGSKTGDIVELEFLSPIKSKWVSDIIEHGSDEKRIYFIDQGRVLPFPLRQWKHKHIVEKIDEENAYIIDNISYSTGNKILDLLIFIPMFLSFYPRKKIYKRYFSKPIS